MAVMVVGTVEIHDSAWEREYGPKTSALIAKHGGKYLALEKQIQLLEGRDRPDAIVVLEFPTEAQAHAWYNDPEYAPMIKLRQSGAALNLLLFAKTV
ncbi:DUF1330 domain-containing protein [Paraburkholderia sp. MM5384-R2]|uniref:DUF1330 domain-containing protein n=1 Tax=Paraburkholderia sp. MM5384-R2 TaxID=2723097 RepID=UPI0016101EED|nr:DUF1330 domain-containing protein [Paraburkholderia sp. MM5384-R2]MBB5499402.1 uncharacterized protein (DUF1330 family) [Paraburkholderia sp. MM5384-R2]